MPSFALVESLVVATAALAGLLALATQASRARQCSGTGFAFGLGWFGVGISWIYISLHVYGQMWAWLAACNRAAGRVPRA